AYRDQLVQEQRRNNGTLADDGKKTLAAWLDEWLALWKSKVEPASYAWYERRVRLRIKPTIGNVRLRQLRPLHVAQMPAALTEKGVSAGEQHKAATTLRLALKEAVNLNLLATNPATRIKKPLHSPKEMHPLDADQANKLLAAARADRLA